MKIRDGFQTLSDAVSGRGNALKAIGQGSDDGVYNGAGTNTSGFSALLVGVRDTYGNFNNLDLYTYIWSSSRYDGAYYNPYSFSLNFGHDNISLSSFWKNHGFAVRCLKN